MKPIEKQMLRNPDIEPTSEVLEEILGTAYSTYVKFLSEMERREIHLEWRYYPDGKAWLGKGLHHWTGSRGGKKEVTVFWLSVWEGYFKLTIYFPEKVRSEVMTLSLSDKLKQRIVETDQMGKLKFFPVVFELHTDESFDAVLTLSEFRKNIK